MTPALARNRTILIAAFLMPCVGVLPGGFAPGRFQPSILSTALTGLMAYAWFA